MAAGRPMSSGPDSSSGSSVGLPPALHGLNRHVVLPEEWTLPHEWKMEKRELFENWKMDVQNQIANLAQNLNTSLRHYPHPEVGGRFDYTDKLVEADMEKKKRIAQSSGEGTNTLYYGLARVPSAQQF